MVNKSPYHAARVNVSRNAFFSSRSEKKNIFFDVDIVVKNKSKCGFSWYVLLSITRMHHYSFPKHFFELFLHIKSLQKFLKESDTYKQLICIMQRVHFQIWVCVSNCQDCGKKQIECGLAWYIVLLTTIRIITLVKICCTFWPLWWRVSLSIKLYIITQVILAFWLVLAYDLLEDRCTIDVIITELVPLPF